MPLCIFAEKILIKTSPSAHRFQRQYNRYPFNKEAFLCACRRGSLTVEAVVVIPVLAGFFVSLLFWFRLIQVQAAVEDALFFAGRKMAVESCVIEDDTILFLGVKALMMAALEGNAPVEQYVEYGSMGVILLGSGLDGEYICLRAHYNVKFPVPLFGLDSIPLWSRETFRKWSGDESSTETVVYITAYGEVYHKMASCRVLALKIYSCSMREIAMKRGEDGQKYYACICCAEEISGTKTVFYTDYGELYHGREDCSYLKRNIREIGISQVGNRRACSYCY